MNNEELHFLHGLGLSVQDSIAKGGFGTIYSVFSHAYKMVFALKKIPEQEFNEAELECLKQLDDPHIVNLYGYYKFNGSVYLLMEYCPRDLQSMIKANQIKTKEDILQNVHGVIMAVKAVHDRNISHCDIKPSNFLIDSYGRVKIGDFGLSKIHKESLILQNARGTKLFMAPELFQQKEFDAILADIWALGVTIYHIATGKFPFMSGTAQGLIDKIQMGAYSLDEVEDKHLRQLIASCLRLRPENRATCEELLNSPFFTQSRRILPSQSLLNTTSIRRMSLQCITKPKLSNQSKLGIINAVATHKKLIKESRSKVVFVSPNARSADFC